MDTDLKISLNQWLSLIRREYRPVHCIRYEMKKHEIQLMLMNYKDADLGYEHKQLSL